MSRIHIAAFNKHKIKELRTKLNSPEYVQKAIDKIASELTHLLFKKNGYY